MIKLKKLLLSRFLVWVSSHCTCYTSRWAFNSRRQWKDTSQMQARNHLHLFASAVTLWSPDHSIVAIWAPSSWKSHLGVGGSQLAQGSRGTKRSHLVFFSLCLDTALAHAVTLNQLPASPAQIWRVVAHAVAPWQRVMVIMMVGTQKDRWQMRGVKRGSRACRKMKCEKSLCHNFA